MRLLRDRQDLAKECMGAVGRLLQTQKHRITSIMTCVEQYMCTATCLFYLTLHGSSKIPFSRPSLPWKLYLS